ncbi:MAG TPA: hypothetical protein VJ851_17210 [Jatrophihabitans sp.]|nr:hypothetical protein [Jatrophihabitans sp.]
MSGWQLLADSDAGKGSPIGFFVVLVLLIAVYFLYRSMNRHLKRVPTSFDPPPPTGEPADPRLLLSDPQPPPAEPDSGDAAPGPVNPREPGPDQP